MCLAYLLNNICRDNFWFSGREVLFIRSFPLFRRIRLSYCPFRICYQMRCLHRNFITGGSCLASLIVVSDTFACSESSRCVFNGRIRLFNSGLPRALHSFTSTTICERWVEAAQGTIGYRFGVPNLLLFRAQHHYQHQGRRNSFPIWDRKDILALS